MVLCRLLFQPHIICVEGDCIKILAAIVIGAILLLNPLFKEDPVMSRYEAPADYHMLYDLNETLKNEDFLTGDMREDGLYLLIKGEEDEKFIPIEDKNIIKKVKYIHTQGEGIYYVYSGFLDSESGIVFFNNDPSYTPKEKGYSHIKDNCYHYSVDW